MGCTLERKPFRRGLTDYLQAVEKVPPIAFHVSTVTREQGLGLILYP